MCIDLELHAMTALVAVGYTELVNKLVIIIASHVHKHVQCTSLKNTGQ